MSGGELGRLSAVDDRGGDVRCEPAQAKQNIKVVGCDPIFASDIVHGAGGILGEPPLNVVSASDDAQKAHIG